MKVHRFESRVGQDGILELQVLLGSEFAGVEVLVIIQPAPAPSKDEAAERADWRQFLEDTYGSCARLGLEREPQGEFEERDAVD